jgi:hypothetical protein
LITRSLKSIISLDLIKVFNPIRLYIVATAFPSHPISQVLVHVFVHPLQYPSQLYVQFNVQLAVQESVHPFVQSRAHPP